MNGQTHENKGYSLAFKILFPSLLAGVIFARIIQLGGM
jgi:hypothetical protein